MKIRIYLLHGKEEKKNWHSTLVVYQNTAQSRFTHLLYAHPFLVEAALHRMIGGTMMTTYLRVPTLITPSQSPTTTRRCTNLSTRCSVNASSFKPKIPMPPLNPNDPFLSKLASVAATSPETLFNAPRNSDTPPYLDIFDSPNLMATPAQVIHYAVFGLF